MPNKKTLHSILSFTENQHPAPSFVVIYIVTWFTWHNQILSYFISAQGNFFTKVMTALGAIEDNQYLVVFFITCLLFIIRLAFNYLMFRSREVLNNADDNFANAREDQIFEKNDDISSLMATLTKTRQKLRESQEREKKAIEEKNATIKKLIAMQHQLDEAQADIDILHKENRG